MFRRRLIFNNSIITRQAQAQSQSITFKRTMSSTGPVTAKYGPEIKNYFNGNSLNRLSFLREDYAFMNYAIQHETTRFLPLNKLEPALTENKELYYLSYQDVKNVLKNSYEINEEEQIKNWDSKKDACGVNKALTVFLGVDQDDTNGTLSYKDKYYGRAYFAIDVTPYDHSNIKNELEQVVTNTNATYTAVRPNGVIFSAGEAPLFAQARQYVDWNMRNKYCGGCGHRLMSVNAGCKLLCPPTDAGVELPSCETRGRVSNLSFPRTDCVIITVVVDYKGEKMLLGRNKRYVGNMYSCLAGFLEPAESIEECVRREVWEESGVKVGRVVLHSTQSWPYPSNIMCGAIAECIDSKESSHEIYLEHDPELADAQWFSFEVVRKALRGDETYMVLPPKQAIAHLLIDSVVNGSSL